MLDEKTRLQYRQGLFAIALAMAQGVPPKEIEGRIMKIPDEKLIEITTRFGELAKLVMAELKLGTP